MSEGSFDNTSMVFGFHSALSSERSTKDGVVSRYTAITYGLSVGLAPGFEASQSKAVHAVRISSLISRHARTRMHSLCCTCRRSH